MRPAVPDQPTIALALKGYRLTTAEILYHMPDHPGLLQTYVWQNYDLAPKFPQLRGFLDFWTRSLDGKLHSVRVAAVEMLDPGHWRHVDGLMTLN